MLLHFLQQNNLYVLNSFFKKPSHTKCSWASPDSVTKNEIGVCGNIQYEKPSTRRTDLGVVSIKICLNTRKGKFKLIRKSSLRQSLATQNAVKYAKLLNSSLSAIPMNVEDKDIVETNSSNEQNGRQMPEIG